MSKFAIFGWVIVLLVGGCATGVALPDEYASQDNGGAGGEVGTAQDGSAGSSDLTGSTDSMAALDSTDSTTQVDSVASMGGGGNASDDTAAQASGGQPAAVDMVGMSMAGSSGGESSSGSADGGAGGVPVVAAAGGMGGSDSGGLGTGLGGVGGVAMGPTGGSGGAPEMSTGGGSDAGGSGSSVGGAPQGGSAGQPATSAGSGGDMSGPDTFRYVRLVATSEVGGNVFTSIAEFNVLDDAGAALARSGWSASADSEETVDESAPASNAIDGDTATYWHTEWSADGLEDTPLPHEFIVDLGSARVITGFRYLPRQNQPNGRIANYEFYLSVDGTNWGTAVATGTFPDSTTEQVVNF